MTQARRQFVEMVQRVETTLRAMAEAGVRGFDCSPEHIAVAARWGQAPAASAPEDLQAVRADLGECQRCKLAPHRRNIVFGKGNPEARLMFVGEAPGLDEDRAGEPFVGAAGQLLTRIIQAIRMTREQVYIANIIKCRPPGNRTPEPDEIATCLPFLKRQIAAIAPQFICALGSVAAQSLLDTRTPISRLRGRFHDLGGVRVLPTYHPAFLLRNPDKKREVWTDMQFLMAAFENR